MVKQWMNEKVESLEQFNLLTNISIQKPSKYCNLFLWNHSAFKPFHYLFSIGWSSSSAYLNQFKLKTSLKLAIERLCIWFYRCWWRILKKKGYIDVEYEMSWSKLEDDGHFGEKNSLSFYIVVRRQSNDVKKSKFGHLYSKIVTNSKLQTSLSRQTCKRQHLSIGNKYGCFDQILTKMSPILFAKMIPST